MKSYKSKLKESIEKQRYTSEYDVHISSPLLDQSSQPDLRNEEKKSENLTVRVPVWVRKLLNDVAKSEDTSINQLVNNALVNALVKHHDNKEARRLYIEYATTQENEPQRATDDLWEVLLEGGSRQINTVTRVIGENALRTALTNDKT